MRRVICLSFIGIMTLTGCSESTTDLPKSSDYSSEKAIKNGDVVFTGSGVTNFNRFQDFLDNMQAHQKYKIRVTAYTKEGDPIFNDLTYDGKKIKYREDSSNDRYGGGSGTTTDSCKKVITKERVKNGVDYHLSGCRSGAEPYLFTKE